MNDFRELQRLLNPGDAPVQLGLVAEVLDAERVVVLLDSGVRRRVLGQAVPGRRVTVQGERLLTTLAPGAERTVYV